VVTSDDISASGGGDKDLSHRGSLLHSHNLVTRDGSLKSVDGVDLSDEDTSTHTVKSSNTALTNITVSSDNSNLSGNHDISGTLDSVNKRLSASVEVVELGLCDGVVDVDSGAQKTVLLALVLEHLVEVVDTGSGLLRHTVAVLEHLGVLGVDESGQVTTVIEDEVKALVVLEGLELLLQAPLVLLLGLALPGKDGDTGGGNGSSSVVLGGEDVARSPGDLCAQRGESLDEDGSLGRVNACIPSSSVSQLT
jgi:hypothetical protein